MNWFEISILRSTILIYYLSYLYNNLFKHYLWLESSIPGDLRKKDGTFYLKTHTGEHSYSTLQLFPVAF